VPRYRDRWGNVGWGKTRCLFPWSLVVVVCLSESELTWRIDWLNASREILTRRETRHVPGLGLLGAG